MPKPGLARNADRSRRDRQPGVHVIDLARLLEQAALIIDALRDEADGYRAALVELAREEPAGSGASRAIYGRKAKDFAARALDEADRMSREGR